MQPNPTNGGRAHGRPAETTAYEDAGAALRARIDELLERCSGNVPAIAASARTTPGGSPRSAAPGDASDGRAVARFLGQLAAAIDGLDPGALPDAGAGFGSTVVVEDLESGTRETYVLVAGPLIDIDAGQVSLASPVGQALLGRRAGEELEVRTPQRQRRLRILEVLTLSEWLDRVEARLGDSVMDLGGRPVV